MSLPLDTSRKSDYKNCSQLTELLGAFCSKSPRQDFQRTALNSSLLYFQLIWLHSQNLKSLRILQSIRGLQVGILL